MNDLKNCKFSLVAECRPTKTLKSAACGDPVRERHSIADRMWLTNHQRRVLLCIINGPTTLIYLLATSHETLHLLQQTNTFNSRATLFRSWHSESLSQGCSQLDQVPRLRSHLPTSRPQQSTTPSSGSPLPIQ